MLSALPVLDPDDQTWSQIDQWIDRAGDAGERFGIGDMLIAAIAATQGSAVWSLADFVRTAHLGFIRLHSAQGTTVDV